MLFYIHLHASRSTLGMISQSIAYLLKDWGGGVNIYVEFWAFKVNCTQFVDKAPARMQGDFVLELGRVVNNCWSELKHE